MPKKSYTLIIDTNAQNTEEVVYEIYKGTVPQAREYMAKDWSRDFKEDLVEARQIVKSIFRFIPVKTWK